MVDDCVPAVARDGLCRSDDFASVSACGIDVMIHVIMNSQDAGADQEFCMFYSQ